MRKLGLAAFLSREAAEKASSSNRHVARNKVRIERVMVLRGKSKQLYLFHQLRLLWRSRLEQIECPGKGRSHDSHFHRLDRDRWLFAGEPADWSLLPASRQWEHGRVFYLGARCFLVAGRDFDGGDYFCRGYS